MHPSIRVYIRHKIHPSISVNIRHKMHPAIRVYIRHKMHPSFRGCNRYKIHPSIRVLLNAVNMCKERFKHTFEFIYWTYEYVGNLPNKALIDWNNSIQLFAMRTWLSSCHQCVERSTTSNFEANNAPLRKDISNYMLGEGVFETRTFILLDNINL